MAATVPADLEALYAAAVKATHVTRDHREAIALFSRIAEPENVARVPRAEGHFLGLVYMGLAYNLMDIERYEEAIARFRDVEPYLPCLALPYVCDFYWSLGNCYGALGSLDALENAMEEAIAISHERLGDAGRCHKAWHFLFAHTRKAAQWRRLERQARAAVAFACQTDHAPLRREAEAVLREARAQRRPRRGLLGKLLRTICV